MRLPSLLTTEQCIFYQSFEFWRKTGTRELLRGKWRKYDDIYTALFSSISFQKKIPIAEKSAKSCEVFKGVEWIAGIALKARGNRWQKVNVRPLIQIFLDPFWLGGGGGGWRQQFRDLPTLLWKTPIAVPLITSKYICTSQLDSVCVCFFVSTSFCLDHLYFSLPPHPPHSPPPLSQA